MNSTPTSRVRHECRRTASGGVEILYTNTDGRAPNPRPIAFGAEVANALRDHFLSELNAWRDPDTGALVVRVPLEDDEDGRAIAVFRPNGGAAYVWEIAAPSIDLLPAIDLEVAGRYYAANPITRPWREAKPGDLWEITYGGKTYPAVVGNDGLFYTEAIAGIAPGDSRITSGEAVYRKESGE